MNKSQLTAKAPRSALPVARVHHSLLEPDVDLDEVRDDPWQPAAILEYDESDWSDDDTDAHASPRYRREAYETLAPEVESELNLLLHGMSYR